MNILLLGAAGFIGTNLTLQFVKNKNDIITLVDSKREYFSDIANEKYENIMIKEEEICESTDFESIVSNQDIVYHLVSTTVPSTSNQKIAQELTSNVVMTSNMLDACVKHGVKKIVFISSGGTVYGTEISCPLKEDTVTNPISSYGIQKITIEKLLYLYRYMYGLDYRIIRLANPYGPYQRPNGVIGAATTFTYKALRNEKVNVYGDGSVVRDFIYIDDAVRAIINIVRGESQYRIFNLGCGYGTSIKQLIETIENALGIRMNITYLPNRKVDVHINYLDISRYEKEFGVLDPLPLKSGIIRTAEFMKKNLII